MDNPQKEKHLTTEELAERWKMEPGTLEVWRQRKKGPSFIKIGDTPQAKVLYPIEEVEAYENARKKTATGAEPGVATPAA